MKTKKDTIDFSRLKEAYDWSYNTALEPFRTSRKAIISDIVGSEYNKSREKVEIPINLINMAVTTYMKRLTTRIPKLSIRAYDTKLRPSAYKLECAVNTLCNDIKLKEVVRSTILEALVSMGCVKVGITQGARVEVGDAFRETGEVFVENIDFEDFIIDMSVKQFNQIKFIGNKYMADVEYVRNCEYFDKKNRMLVGEVNNGVADTAREIGSQPTNNLYKNMTRLVDLYLPCENMFVTYDDTSGNVLYAEEWGGVGCPYIPLAFMPVLSNIMPLSLAETLMPLHMANNRIWSKLINQAERQKSLLLTTDNENDVKNINTAKDGSAVKITNPVGAQMQNFGTVEQTSFALGERILDRFSWCAGNLDTLGGLSSQAGTATQEAMLNQNSSINIQDMQNVLFDFMQNIYKQVTWFVWQNPYIEIPFYLPIKGTDKSLYSVYNENSKEGNYLDYVFELSPYSIDNNTPGSKLMAIKQILNEVIFPMLPLMQQQGITLDYEKTIKLIAKYADVKDIDDIIRFAVPTMESIVNSEASDVSVKSNSPRHDTRQYVPSTNTNSRGNIMAQIMAGGKPQPNDTNKL